MKPVTDYRSMTGPQKVAALLLAMPDEQSGRLLSMMSIDETQSVAESMANLGKVDATLIERLFVDFADAISGGSQLKGDYDTTERLLMKSLDPDRVRQIMEELRGPAGRTIWEKLENVNETSMAGFLRNEYPQTVAVILSKVSPKTAARVMDKLPEGLANDVVGRMLTMENVSKEVLDAVERVLRTEFMSNLARQGKRDAYGQMAEIFNNMPDALRDRFVKGVDERSKDDAEKIVAKMFTFRDLAKIEPKGIQMLLNRINKKSLALALKGQAAKDVNYWFENMSERAGKMLKDEIEGVGPLRKSEVEAARREIVEVAKLLINADEIKLMEGEDDLVI